MTESNDVTKLCASCEKPLPSRRLKYHPECSERERTRVRCGKCRKIKPAAKFSNDKTRASGKFPYCMSCQKDYQTEHLMQDPTAELTGKLCPLCDTPIRGAANRVFCSVKCKDRCSRLRRFYGLTPRQFRDLVDATGGRCPVCGNRPSEWHVDHDHKTGKVTGVVCNPCNVGALAFTFHDVDFVRRLLAYLEDTPASKLGADTIGTATPQKSQLHALWGHKRRGGPQAQKRRPEPQDPPF